MEVRHHITTSQVLDGNSQSDQVTDNIESEGLDHEQKE